MGQITKHKTTLVFNGVKFDSDEEVYIAMWLQELQDAGFVKKWSRASESINMTSGLKIPYTKITQLKTKTKEERREFILLRPSEYTYDFEVTWTHAGVSAFLFGIFNESPTLNPKDRLFYTTAFNVTLLEVKPSFDQNNMERLFVLNQKFLYDKHKIFVNMVEPVALFEKTFLPLAAAPYFKYQVSTKKMAAKGKQKGDWKLDFTPKRLKQFLNEKGLLNSNIDSVNADQ
jgi:hypothetical protein